MTWLPASVLIGLALLVYPVGTRPSVRLLSRRRSQGRAAGTRGDRADALGELPPALVMELAAAALDAGLPPPRAVAAAVRVAGRGTRHELEPIVQLWQLGAPVGRAWRDAHDRWQPLARSLILSERTGASAAHVLRAAAGDLRSARRRDARVSAHRLGVALVVPLGLTTLPAFLLWAVVPVVIGLAQQVLAGS